MEYVLDHWHSFNTSEGDNFGHALLQSCPYLLKINFLRAKTHLFYLRSVRTRWGGVRVTFVTRVGVNRQDESQPQKINKILIFFFGEVVRRIFWRVGRILQGWERQ